MDRLTQEDIDNYASQMGRALRRKARRVALEVINEDDPTMSWRDKVQAIDELTKIGPIYMTCLGETRRLA